MSVFVDTSGLLAILDAEDLHHAQAAACWKELIERDEPLVSTSYVLVETFALVQKRLGLAAAHRRGLVGHPGVGGRGVTRGDAQKAAWTGPS